MTTPKTNVGMEVEQKVRATLIEALNASGDPNIGAEAARNAIKVFIHDCFDWVADEGAAG